MIRTITIVAVGIAIVAVMAATLFSFAPNESDEATDVIVIMGQSNADYREQTAVAAEASPFPTPGTAWYYGTEAQPADFLDPPTSCGAWPISTASGARIGDKWPAMAAAYKEATGHDVAMFSLAIEGVSITTFEPDSITGYAWDKCEGQTRAALAAFEDAGMTIGRISVVWVQGEQDDNDGMSGEDYKAHMMSVFTAILNGGLGEKVTGPIWICKVRQARAPEISVAQVEFCQEHPGIARIATELADGFTISNGLMTDRSHYTQAGNNILGTAIGEAVGHGVDETAKKDDTMWRLIGIGVVVVIAGMIVILTRE